MTTFIKELRAKNATIIRRNVPRKEPPIKKQIRSISTSIEEIEGIGKVYAIKLKKSKVNTIESLLEAGCNKKGRKALAENSGISEKLILNWVNRADLARIKGISTQYADLLEFAGVDSVPELAQRKPENLHAKILEVNDEKNLVRKVAALSKVEDWVTQAKNLPKKVTH